MSESETTTQRVGQLLKARYRIERVLHTGTQTCVYAGTDTRSALNARVAIKLLPPERARDQAFHDRFVQQAYLANAVGHPSTVIVLDAGSTEDGAAFLIMELLAAPSLATLRAEYGGRLPLRLACAIADQCLDMLACAHPQQIFHGALSPERLFWARGSQLKVLGFGAGQRETALPVNPTSDPTTQPDTSDARNADLNAVAGLWQWLLGQDTAQNIATSTAPDAQDLILQPQSLLAVFDKARDGGWASADAMRRALSRAHRTALGSRVDAGRQPTAAGNGLDAPLSWLWIWLAAAGLAAALLALSALLSEPEHAPRPSADAPLPIAEADAIPADGTQAREATARLQRDAASGEAQASEAADEAEQEPPPSGPRAHEHSVVQPIDQPIDQPVDQLRVIPRGPSLKGLQLPMLGRHSEAASAHAALVPIAIARRQCTELATRRREEPLSDSDQRTWEEHCQKY